ncbi:MAG: hypothetical protein U1E14_21180 [Geminicoccaceae bacterium]
MSLKTWAFAALLAVAAVPSAWAEAVDSAKLSACMLDKATTEDEALMRRAIAAILLDQNGEAKRYLGEISLTYMRLLTKDCGTAIDPANGPAIQQALQQFGIKFGMRIMQKAFGQLFSNPA